MKSGTTFDQKELEKLFSKIPLTQREKDLITQALYMMETLCIGHDLPCEVEDSLHGTPDDEEVRNLMIRIDNG